MVRMARRRSGVSQRELARRAGVATATVAGIEAGNQNPSLRVLSRLLEAAGLELAVDRPVQPLCAHVSRHLHASLSVRLHRALGGNGWPWSRPVLPAWQQLGRLATSARVFVTGDLAAALWLPDVDAVRPVVAARPRSERPFPPTPDLEVRTAAPPEHCTVPVPLTVGAVWTMPPDELALLPEHAVRRRVLRAVASELDSRAARDPHGRRQPAHREPRPQEEQLRLMFARRWTASFLPPDRHDARGWRLDDEVGMRQWIERRAVRR